MLSFIVFVALLVAFLGSAIVLNYLKTQLDAEELALVMQERYVEMSEPVVLPYRG